MRFKSCRKCGYNYIPPEYDHCPKCQAKLGAGGGARKAMLAFVGVAAIAAVAYFAVTIAPRLSIVVN